MMLKPLGDIAEYINGRAFKPSEWSNKGLPIIRIQNLNNEENDFNYYKGDYSVKHFVKNGDVLLSWSGTPGTSFGCFLWKKQDALLNQHIFKVVLDENTVYKKYFIYCVNANLHQLINNAHGGVGLKHITKPKLLKLKIPLPSLDTQKKISDILDKADAIRRRNKEILKKYDQLAQSVFYEMFGDPVRNEKGWENLLLSNVCTVQGGYAFKSDHYKKQGIKIVKIGNVHYGQLVWDEVDYVEEAYLEKYSTFSLYENDILIALTRPIIKSLDTVKTGVVRQEDLPALLNQRVARLIPNEERLRRSFFLQFMYLPYFKNTVEKLASTNLQPNVSTRQLENIKIIVPPIDQQIKFERIMETINLTKSRITHEKLKSEQLFKSLLQKAFKGELFDN